MAAAGAAAAGSRASRLPGFQIYVVVSVLSAIFSIHRTFAERQMRFYDAMVAIASSKSSLLVVGNACFAVALTGAKVAQKVLLGDLRAAEYDILSEHASATFIHTMIALTMFREELSIPFAFTFCVMLFLKGFFWISSARLKFLQQTPVTSRRPLHKLGLAFVLLLLASTWVAYGSLLSLLDDGMSFVLLFATEATVLMLRSASSLLHFAVYMSQLQPDGTWERSGSLLFFADVFFDIAQVSVFVSSFVLITYFYGLPIYFLRDIFASFKRFRQRLFDLVRYRQLCQRVDQWFPDHRIADFPDQDTTCVVCREQMATAKRLHCGHMFHRKCLLEWGQQNNTCPLCRAPIIPPSVLQQQQHHHHQQQQHQQQQQQQADGGSVRPGQPDRSASAVRNVAQEVRQEARAEPDAMSIPPHGVDAQRRQSQTSFQSREIFHQIEQALRASSAAQARVIASANVPPAEPQGNSAATAASSQELMSVLRHIQFQVSTALALVESSIPVAGVPSLSSSAAVENAAAATAGAMPESSSSSFSSSVLPATAGATAGAEAVRPARRPDESEEMYHVRMRRLARLDPNSRRGDSDERH